MSRESVAFNIKEPQPSVFGEQARLARQEPTTAEVLGAYIEEAFQGEGTFVQDIAAGNIKKQERRGEPITQEAWKQSDNFRDGLKWYKGMTTESARTLAEIEDDRNERKNIFDRASGIQKGFGIGTQLVTGIFEPKNFHSGQIAAITTAGLGSAAPTIGRMMTTQTVKGAATRGAVEGAAAAGFSEISSRESSRIVQGDYTMADTLMNFGLSMVLGAGIGAGGKGLEKRARGKRLEEIQKFRADRAIATKEFDTALGQMTQGQRVDVEAVAEVENLTKANKAVKGLPVIEEKLNTKIAESKLVPVTERPEFKRWFEGSEVVDGDGKPLVVYHGTPKGGFTEFSIKTAGQRTEQMADNVAFHFSDNPTYAGNYSGASAFENRRKAAKILGYEPEGIELPEAATTYPVYLSMKNPKQISSSGDINANVLKQAKEEGFDSIITQHGNGQEYIVFKPEQIKSIFNRGAFDPNDPRLIDINEAEALQTRKGQLEQDAGRTLNDAPIDNLKKSLETNANSSAYDDVMPKSVVDSLELAKQSDDKIFQDNLQFAQEQAQEMLEQGQLTDADIKNLERLENIDTKIEIYDNIYSNLKNCLVR